MTKQESELNRQLKIYRDALSNIAKLGSKCWENGKVHYDSSFVAHVALEKAEPEYFKSIESVKFTEFYVKRDGTFHQKKTKISKRELQELTATGLKFRRELEKRLKQMTSRG